GGRRRRGCRRRAAPRAGGGTRRRTPGGNGDAPAEVAGVEQRELDPRLGRGGRRRTRLVEAEVVELADGGVAVRAQLPVDLHVLAADLVDGERGGELEHLVAPGPEVAAPVAAPPGALER